jgi:hypothetical protein
VEKYFKPSPFYDILLYLNPIPAKWPKIDQFIFFAGQFDSFFSPPLLMVRLLSRQTTN